MEWETRMALVEQSYNNLEKRIDKVEEKLDGIKEQMTAGQTSMTKVIIGTTGTILVALISTIGVILTQMP